MLCLKSRPGMTRSRCLVDSFPVPFAVCSSEITVVRGAHDALSKLDHPSSKK